MAMTTPMPSQTERESFATTLVLPYPISANRYWRSYVPKGWTRSVTAPSAEAKAYKNEVRWIAKGAGIRAAIVGKVQLSIWLYPHRPQDAEKRMRKLGGEWDDSVQCIDLDNANKVLIDALTGVVIQDDSFVRRIESERMEPDGKARVVVEVSRYVRSDVVQQVAMPLEAPW
jgi:crossover junction endodeoxyribonuclease RusA